MGIALRNGILFALLSLLAIGASCGSGEGGKSGGAAGGGSCQAVSESCSGNSDCCSSSCKSGECTCKPSTYYCLDASECCPDLECKGVGTNRPGVCGVPGGGCLDDGKYCTYAYECCSSFCDAHVCKPSRCLNAGADCELGSWCCGGLGCQGFDPGKTEGACSSTCGKDGATCTRTNDCCSSFECDQSTHTCTNSCGGMDTACGVPGAPPCCRGTTCKGGKCSACVLGNCQIDDQCCDGLYCGFTGAVYMCTCGQERQPCDDRKKCCTGLTCSGGVCG